VVFAALAASLDAETDLAFHELVDTPEKMRARAVLVLRRPTPS